MLSADLPPRHGVGRKAGTWVLLLVFYLHLILSEHRIFVTFSGACTPPDSSASEEEKAGEQQQQQEQPESVVSSPPCEQPLPNIGQNGAPNVQGGLGARPRRNTISVFRRPSAQPSSLSPQQTGSILFFYASLLLGKGGSTGLSASRFADTDDESPDLAFRLLSRLSTREAALTVASLATAVRHLRMVRRRTHAQVRAIAALEKSAPKKTASEKAASEEAASGKAAPKKAASEKAASEEAASEEAASEEAPSGEAPSEGTGAAGDTAESREITAEAGETVPEGATSAGAEAAENSQPEIAIGNKDRRSSVPESSQVASELQRFAGADRISEAVSTERTRDKEMQRMSLPELMKSKSLKNLVETDEKKTVERDRRRFFSLRRFSRVACRQSLSPEHKVGATPKKASWSALKSFLCTRDLHPGTPYCARKAEASVRSLTSYGNRQWSGAVAAVADAISKACDQGKRVSLTPAAEEEPKEVIDSKRRESVRVGVSRPPSRAPGDTEDEPTMAVHEKCEQTRTSPHKGTETQLRETLGASDAPVDGTGEPCTVNVHSTRRTHSESKAPPSGSTEKKPDSRGKARRGVSLAELDIIVPSRADSRPSPSKSETAVSRSSLGQRLSSSDRKSSSGSDGQRESSGKAERRRRWLGLRKSKTKSRQLTLARSSVEDDTDASWTQTYGAVEGAVRAELTGEGARELLATGEQWWRESREIKAKEVHQRIIAALPSEQLLTPVASSTVEQWTVSIIRSTTADMSQLITQAAQLVDTGPFARTRRQPEAASFRSCRHCRLAFFVVCSELLDQVVLKGFNASTLKEAQSLRKVFAAFEAPHSRDEEVIEKLSGIVAKMQALVAVTETLELSESTAAVVTRAHLELRKLTERVSHVEGTGVLLDYYISGRQSSKLIEERVKEMMKQIEVEVIQRVCSTLEGALSERLSRYASSSVLEMALEADLLQLMVPHVHRTVAADLQAARSQLPELAVPPVYHLTGLLNDPDVKTQVVNYHVHEASSVLPHLFYHSLPILLPRLAMEYRWLQDAACLGLPTVFERERDLLNARVLVAIALTEVFGLQHSVYAHKLNRIVKVSKQLGFDKEVRPALEYIYEQLTSPETEDAALTAAEVLLPRDEPKGISFEKAFLQSIAWLPSVRGSESGDSQQE